MARREFLKGGAAACAFSLLSTEGVTQMVESANATGLDFPLLDLHVHLDGSAIDKVLELSAERSVKFGIVEHAGTKENKYPVVLCNDDELKGYLAMLDGKPVFKGVQAEWTDWMGCFSPAVLAQLDFVLSDAMTFPRKDGERMKLWEEGAEIGDAQSFMDRYVDWHVEIMANEPLDILANVSWLPASVAADYDALWTDPRMTKVIDAAVKYGVALEISSGFKLPKLRFLEMAKSAGAKFTLGSNGRYPKMGLLDYSVQTARELGLTHTDMFTPAPDGRKAVLRRLPGVGAGIGKN